MNEVNQTPPVPRPPAITDDTPVGPDIDLDTEVVLLADGTRLTNEMIPGLVNEIRIATGGTAEWPGIVEAAELLNFRIGAWHDFGYATPPAPNCKTIPPLGERSADAIKAGHGAIEVIDEITRDLQALRDQLIRELRTDEGARAPRVDATPAEARASAAGLNAAVARDALAAVLKALDIPSPATVGDGEVHDRILQERALHAVVFLRSLLDDGRVGPPEWGLEYFREKLAEHPATGYRTWQQAVAGRRARRETEAEKAYVKRRMVERAMSRGLDAAPLSFEESAAVEAGFRREYQDGARACSCPESDGAIRHQRSSCTDPVVARLGWYADGAK